MWRLTDADRTTEDVRGWLNTFRSAFAFGAMTCPAARLADPAVASWVRRKRLCVDVDSVVDLDVAVSRGIAPARIVVHGSEGSAAPLRGGCQLGVGRYVVGSVGQSAVLAAATTRRTPVIADITDDDAALEHAVGAVHLEAIGVRMRLSAAYTPADLGPTTLTMIAKMADIRRRHGVLLTRINIADLDMRGAVGRHLRTDAAVIEDAIDDACARYRFPRPTVIVSPRTR